MTVFPNFFLAGPPKCGTTSIAHQLGRHPDVHVCEPKEPNYFVYQGGNPYRWPPEGKDDKNWYLGLFPQSDALIAAGDASPVYFNCFHVVREIHKFNPEARIIVVLRNPVYRAFSMYRYWYQNNPHRQSGSDFVEKFFSEGLFTAFELEAPIRFGWLQGAGFYTKHISPYLELFPREKILITFFADLVDSPKDYYESLFLFLGVRPEKCPIELPFLNKTDKQPSLRKVHWLLWNPSQSKLGAYLKSTRLREPLKAVRDRLTLLNR